MTFDIIVLSIISSIVIYLLWLINVLLYKIFLILNTLIVLGLPDDHDAKKHVLKSFKWEDTVPIMKFEL